VPSGSQASCLTRLAGILPVFCSCGRLPSLPAEMARMAIFQPISLSLHLTNTPAQVFDALKML
jgi:hypothetical protein